MKLRIALIVLALSCVGGYAATVTSPLASSTQSRIGPLLAEPTSHASELLGVWEGLDPDGFQTRLVVEEVSENWATVLYTWGDDPAGTFERGWARVRAKVLADRSLVWRYPGDFSFRLLDAGMTFVGKREQAGRSAEVLMKRLPSEVALRALSPTPESSMQPQVPNPAVESLHRTSSVGNRP